MSDVGVEMDPALGYVRIAIDDRTIVLRGTYCGHGPLIKGACECMSGVHRNAGPIPEYNPGADGEDVCSIQTAVIYVVPAGRLKDRAGCIGNDHTHKPGVDMPRCVAKDRGWGSVAIREEGLCFRIPTHGDCGIGIV